MADETANGNAPLDPNELLQIPPMKRSEVANLVACVDAVLKSEGLKAAEICSGLAASLLMAKPVAAPANEGNRAARRREKGARS